MPGLLSSSRIFLPLFTGNCFKWFWYGKGCPCYVLKQESFVQILGLTLHYLKFNIELFARVLGDSDEGFVDTLEKKASKKKASSEVGYLEEKV